MRAPSWLRVRRSRRTAPRTVTVTIVADTSAFEASLRRLKLSMLENERIRAHRRRLAYERTLGRAQVSVLLDDMCRDLGYPISTWRNPEGA